MNKYDIIHKIVSAFGRREHNCDFAIICNDDCIIIQVINKTLAIGCKHIITIEEAIHWVNPNITTHRIVGNLIKAVENGGINK